MRSRLHLFFVHQSSMTFKEHSRSLITKVIGVRPVKSIMLVKFCIILGLRNAKEVKFAKSCAELVAGTPYGDTIDLTQQHRHVPVILKVFLLSPYSLLTWGPFRSHRNILCRWIYLKTLPVAPFAK
jgi:hypothetical protein